VHRKSVLLAVPCDLKRLSIGALEAFVLSQVGERSLVEDVAETAGLEVDEMLRVAERLSELGALVVVDGTTKGKRSSASLRAAKVSHPPESRRSSASLRAAKATKTTVPPTQGRGSGAHRAAKTSARPIRVRLGALSDAERARIADMAARVDVTSHYEVLGVERDADTKTIRRAYHALAAQFHPDRFFGKELGASKRPLERIFDRITRAYETLSRKAEREAYDVVLGPQPANEARTRTIISHAAEVSAAAAPVRRSSRKMKAAAKVASERPSPAKIAAPAPAHAPAPAPAPALAPAPAHAPALAPGPATAPLTARGSVGGASSPLRAARPDALLRMYTDKQQKTARERVGVFLRAAKEALDRDDVVAAAEHYRLAAQCTADPAVHAALVEVDERARVRIHATSLAQARAAESAGRWGEAGSRYARAYDAQREAWVAERAANAMRQDGKELKRAAQLAEQAVLAEPHNAAYRVTLGEIYCDAGLMHRAAGEAGRASALAPADARVRALSSRVANVKRK
jgi:DnaJ domain